MRGKRLEFGGRRKIKKEMSMAKQLSVSRTGRKNRRHLTERVVAGDAYENRH